MTAGRWNLLILVLCLLLITVLSCDQGYNHKGKKCVDYDECAPHKDEPDKPSPCGNKAKCVNTEGSFYCQCLDGFRSSLGNVSFSAETSATCLDINECMEDNDICGPNTKCVNTAPYYQCHCNDGFNSTTRVEIWQHDDNVTCSDIDECQDKMACGQNATCINTQGSYECICNAGYEQKPGKSECEGICMINKTICGNGNCHQGSSGHYCECPKGFTNFGNDGSRCTALSCNVFKDMVDLTKEIPTAHKLMGQLEKNCGDLTEGQHSAKLNGEDLLERVLSMIDEVLSGGAFKDNRKLSTFLDMVETVLFMIGPFVQTPGRNISSSTTELEFVVHKGRNLPQGTKIILHEHAKLDIQLETAAGDPSNYPGFTILSMLSFLNLKESANGFFGGVKAQTNQKFEINSKVVTVIVSNRNTSHLKDPVKLKFYHLNQSVETNHTCVFWNSSEEGGAWSDQGCSVVESNLEYTVCSCTHLSSFAVLMALYEIENKFELTLLTWVGLPLSLICLFICILTFSLIRSIQSPRTTIHLHLCISLFIAMLIFLAGISQTENKVGCAVVAGLLHFFFMAAFCWMCLEGIQLFRMVVLVFNTTFRTRYMMAGGYGVPAVIVAISALANSKGYGTEKYCWLNLDFIWSFFGPVCFIIAINIFFFLITAWKLAQKFSSLNPDLDNLQKIKAFIITAVAQLCVLGTMWIFGCFQFQEGTIVMSYLFTIFGSFQGVLLFVMHCLFSKQVREEYVNLLSRFCAPQKKRYSEFGYSNSSKANTSKSTQDTGESHI